MSTLLHQLQIFYTGCIKVNVSDPFDQLAEVMEVHGVHQRWNRASVSCWKFVVLCYVQSRQHHNRFCLLLWCHITVLM